MYVVGGFNGHLYYNSVRSFGKTCTFRFLTTKIYWLSLTFLDLKTKQWKEKAPMNSRRCYLSLANLNGQIWYEANFDHF